MKMLNDFSMMIDGSAHFTFEKKVWSKFFGVGCRRELRQYNHMAEKPLQKNAIFSSVWLHQNQVGFVVAQFIGLTGIFYFHLQNDVMDVFSVAL